jgi:tyrosinase
MARKSSVVSATPAPTTRYERVKQILGAAARPSAPPAKDAKPKLRFWELSLEEFKQADIYGVRLIAPEQPASCCSGGASRSANSGLIKALRGIAPFDGSRFPPRPWGSSQLSDADIQFIAEWIDDGCPPDDEGNMPLAVTNSGITHAKVIDLAEFDVGKAGARRYVYRDGEPRQRANIDCLGEDEVDELRDAFRQIYDLDRNEEDRRNFNNQALIHQNHCQHGWERFLPWHRAYLYEFEQNLQDFKKDITVPYWDWTMPLYKPHTPEKGCIIPQALQAFLRPEVLDHMFETLKPTAAQAKGFRDMTEPRMYFASQHKFFCHVIDKVGFKVTPDPIDPNRMAMIDALLASNALWYPLRYPGEYPNGQSINQNIHYHYPTAEDIEQILSLNNFRDFGGGNVYNASFGFIDQNPHNTMHIWTGGKNPEFLPPPDFFAPQYTCDKLAPENPELPRGQALAERRSLMVAVKDRKFHTSKDMYSQPPLGDMFSNLTASYDPIFWPVHANIDRLWSEWQTRNPTGVPYDLDSVLSPWSYTIRDMLDISRFGYEYVCCSYFMPVGMEAPIGRFVSKPIKINERARKFTRAEIRMHWVPQLVRSCFVRAFINQPGANASTEIRDNPHYAGYLAIFGHGECYGGPGHCDLPPSRARPFDQRPRGHNMPRNHRLDVTAAVRRMLDQGKKIDELQITLLVIGVDYCEENDLLRLEGVSLNFLD